MNNTRQSSVLDLVKLIGLIVVIGLVVFDIFSVRRKNEVLLKSIETQKVEMERKLNAAIRKGADYEQALRNAERFTLDAKAKAKESESELTGRITTMEDAHRKELEAQRVQADELRASLERKLQEIKEDFARQKERMQERLQEKREAHLLAQKEAEAKRTEEKANDSSGELQDQPKQSVAELKQKIKANQDEIKSLRMKNPGYILVNSAKQARILETRFRPSSLGKYLAKDQVTYVRDLFHCTACNWDCSENEGPCCEVSRKRSFNLWRKAMHDAHETARINERIDELLKENETLKKAMR